MVPETSSEWGPTYHLKSKLNRLSASPKQTHPKPSQIRPDPKKDHQNRSNLEELSINQSRENAVSFTTLYFLQRRHLNKGDREVPSLSVTPTGSRQPFAEAVIHRTGFYALSQLSY
jgi:hypothetical protein